MKGITDAGLKPRKMKKIAVLGGGLMGSGIATASALAGMDVIIKEVNDKFLQVRQLLETAGPDVLRLSQGLIARCWIMLSCNQIALEESGFSAAFVSSELV